MTLGGRGAPSRWLGLAVAVVPHVTAASGALAQMRPPVTLRDLGVGEPVRLWTGGLDRRGRRAYCAGSVAARDGDTVRLAPAPGCPTGAYALANAELAVARGRHRSRLAHGATGLVVGAASGAALGAGYVFVGCARSATCTDASFGYAVLGTLGGMAGGAVGTLVGLAWPTGPRWIRVRGPGAVQVGIVPTSPGGAVAVRAAL